MAIILKDTFTAPNGTSIKGHLPDISPNGNTWDGSSGVNATIQNNTLLSSDRSYATIDSTVSDFTLTYTLLKTAQSYGRVMFRGSPNGDFLWLCAFSGTTWRIYKTIGGVSTILLEASGTNFNTSDVQVKIICSGNNIQVYTDDILLGEVTETDSMTGTMMGIEGYNYTSGSGGSTYDDFIVNTGSTGSTLTADASLSGAGATTITPIATFNGGASMVGGGTLSPTATLVQSVLNNSLSGAGVLTADGLITTVTVISANSSLSGTGIVTVEAIKLLNGAVNMGGVGNAVLSAVKGVNAGAMLTGKGLTTVNGLRAVTGVFGLAGVGTLTADGTVTLPTQGAVFLTGTGLLLVDAIKVATAGAGLTGLGNAVLSAVKGVSTGANLTGSGFTTATGVRALTGEITLAGLASFIVGSVQGTITAQATLNAVSSLQAQGVAVTYGSADFVGSGDVLVYLGKKLVGSVVLGGTVNKTVNLQGTKEEVTLQGQAVKAVRIVAELD